MELREYLKTNGITLTEFAGKLSCQQSYVSLLINKKRRPSPDMALKIEQFTNGAVTRMELLYPDQEAA